MRELTPSDPNRDTAFLFANVGVILLFISIFTFGTWVLTGVVEEKQSRVVEVVLSTVAARDLLIGKVLGIGLLGLVQLVLMVAVGLAARGSRRTGSRCRRRRHPRSCSCSSGSSSDTRSTRRRWGSSARWRSRMEEASNASAPVEHPRIGRLRLRADRRPDDPAGVPARIATFIPPVSPMVVPLRAALGAIEPWEILLSVR